MLAAREHRERTIRNADRKARRLASAASVASSVVNDDESDCDGDGDISEATFEKLQDLFIYEPTKK
jgi:hypothetical protein